MTEMKLMPDQKSTAEKFEEVLSCLEEPLEPVDLAKLIAILVVTHGLDDVWDQMSDLVGVILADTKNITGSMSSRLN